MKRITASVIALLLAAPLSAGAYVGYDNDADPLYGYSDTDHSSDPDSPTYSFTSISSSGTSIPVGGGVMGPYPIGFPFDYYETVYTEVWVSTYGVLLFESGSPSSWPSTIPSASSPNGFVAGGWTWYDTWSGGTAYYATRGTAPSREFVVEWAGLYTDDWVPATFQIVLEEATGDIYVLIQSLTSTWSTWAIGLENQDGTRGIQAFYGTGTRSSYACVFTSMGERPRVRVLTPDLTVPEGGTLDLEVQVTDRQDDLDTVTWDLDGDTEFDDGDGESVTVSAERIDGPATFPVYCRATDLAGNERISAIEIEVTNEPPVFMNEPVTEILRGETFEYIAEIYDPGGDDVDVTAPTRPGGMAVLGTGGVRWTTTDDDVGDHEVVLVAVDDDDDPEVDGDGDAVLEFTLTVLENTAPTAPGIIEPRMNEVLDTLTPTFRVTTPTDPEDDPLQLTFDIDTVDTFDSPRLVSSGRIPATRGETGWTSDQDLEDGQAYWWRCYAWDGHDQGPAARGRFSIDLGGGGDGGVDGGVDGGDDGGSDVTPPGSCQCRAGSGSAAAGLLPALLLVAFFFLARRR